MFVCLWVDHEYWATDINSCCIDLGQLSHVFCNIEGLGIENVVIFVHHDCMLCRERIKVDIKDTLAVRLCLIDTIDLNLSVRHWPISQRGNPTADWSTKDLETLQGSLLANLYSCSAICWLEDLAGFGVWWLRTNDDLAWLNHVKLIPSIAVSEHFLNHFIVIFGRQG